MIESDQQASPTSEQTVNVAGIARDAGIARQTATDFFSILIDTLIATWLPAWKLKRAVKQIAHPKLFLFDTGVARQLAGTAHLPMHPEERGPLLETWLLHEVRAYLHYHDRIDPVAYWRTHGGKEVDFVIETAAGIVAIEVKSGDRWDRRFAAGMHALREHLPSGTMRMFGVFAGPRAQVVDDVQVLPWQRFVEDLWAGRVL